MSNKTTIGFSGDVSFSAFFKDVYKKEDLLSPEIHKFFEGNDANIINQESPITECRITRKKRLSHRTDVDVIPKFYQKTIPNVIVSLANNHMLDYGRIGVIDSCENLEKYNCPYIGIGRNRLEASRYIIVGEDVKVGVIAIEYKRFKPHGGKWAAPFYEGNMGALANRITTMKQDEKVDWVVVVYHGGEEFLNFPLPFNKKLVHRIADLGADAVVAHHPHVVQGYEYYKGKPIFYSLGNFIFDTTYQRAQEGTTEGMLVKLNFTKDEITWDNLPRS
ncbi:MAG: CapA family protein, partial [Eubacterium sp.]